MKLMTIENDYNKLSYDVGCKEWAYCGSFNALNVNLQIEMLYRF